MKSVFVTLFEFLLENKNFYASYLLTNEQAFMEQSDFTNFIKIVKNNNIDAKFLPSERIYHMAFFAGSRLFQKVGLKLAAKNHPNKWQKLSPMNTRLIQSFLIKKVRNSPLLLFLLF